MKSIIFDTGPIISLTLNNLAWILEPLKNQFGGKFYIPEAVRKELVDRPLEINRFKFEALHTMHYIDKGIITLYPEKDYESITNQIMDLCNNLFYAKGRPVRVAHRGEIEVIALAITANSNIIVVDERTTTELIENPERVKKRLMKRLHTKVTMDEGVLKKLNDYTKGLKVIRSVELAVMAYEMGLLDRYLPDGPFDKGVLLDAVLWGLKLNGCAITEDEIKSIVRLELGQKEE